MKKRHSTGRSPRRQRLPMAGLALALATAAGAAQATDVFRLEGFGAVSRAMGGVATAHDVGPAGMMTNPATLSLMEADNAAMVGLDLVTTDIDVRNRDTGENAPSRNHGANRGPYFAPELGNVYKRRGPDFIKAWMASMPSNTPGRRQMPQFNLTEEQTNNLIEFLKWTGEINTENWPPNIEG